MKRTFTGLAIVLAAALAACPFFSASSAEDRAPSYTTPAAKAPRTSVFDPFAPRPIAPSAADPTYRASVVPSAPAYAPTPYLPAAPVYPAPATIPYSPPGAYSVPVTPDRGFVAKAESYSRAISEAVTAEALTREEGRALEQEFEAFIAVRKARLDIIQGIRLLEKTAKDEAIKETKEAKAAKRLLETMPKREQLNLEPPVR